MNEDMTTGIVLAVATLVLIFGGVKVIASQHSPTKPIDIVKEAYEEYGCNYAFKIIEENLDTGNAEEWSDAIEYLGEAEFGYMWDKAKREMK